MAQPYHLIRQIPEFDIIDFIPHLGWIASELLPAKIYILPGSYNYFLHEERSNRLVEFSAEQPASLNSTHHYWQVIEHFKFIISGLSND